MNNRKDQVSINTGGAVSTSNRKYNNLSIKSPEKTDMEPKEEIGLAKASPNFKEVEPKIKKTKAEEKKAIEDNTLPEEEAK